MSDTDAVRQLGAKLDQLMEIAVETRARVTRIEEDGKRRDRAIDTTTERVHQVDMRVALTEREKETLTELENDVKRLTKEVEDLNRAFAHAKGMGSGGKVGMGAGVGAARRASRAGFA